MLSLIIIGIVVAIVLGHLAAIFRCREDGNTFGLVMQCCVLCTCVVMVGIGLDRLFGVWKQEAEAKWLSTDGVVKSVRHYTVPVMVGTAECPIVAQESWT